MCVVYRYPGLGPGGLHQFSLYPGPGGPSQAAALSQLERERLERLGIPAPGSAGSAPPTSGPPPAPPPAPTSALDAERLTLTTDPMVRLQMAGISPEYHAHTHAHTHAHSHTHLHLHPGQQAGQGQAPPAPPDPTTAFPLPASGSAGYPRPSLLPPREAALALHHPSELLPRPYADQLAHQAAAHEHLQRQILLERERFPHPSLVAHHEEYLRIIIPFQSSVRLASPQPRVAYTTPHLLISIIIPFQSSVRLASPQPRAAYTTPH
ncbi:hypothetical protein J6590_031211 [Homalodisca vitripennis]|nr:hypothetical protein J6590_031211 [Homalodisca vitripennis]